MDPTKSFDHLDPKLKETYARVMATTTSSATNAAPDTTSLSATPTSDPGLSPTPTSFDPAQLAGDSSQLSSSPFSQPTNPTPDTGPNPGTGPTINTLPLDTTSTFSSPTDTATPAPQSAQDTPPTSSFFSNPSPAPTDPSQVINEPPPAAPVEPSTEPATVTPYIPESVGNDQGATEQYTEPLPSPAAVNQAAPHETSALLKVLYIVGAVIFFAVYTIFWIKVFNLPFLF